MKVELNGIEYYVEERGQGFPLLLFHGFTGSSSTWDHLTGLIGKTSRNIMPDIIGHGRTSSPPEVERYSILKVAADLNLLLDKFGIQKIDLLGYSMGGRLAITFAVNYPERVRKLVLESTTPGLKTLKEREIRQKHDVRLAAKIHTEGVESFIDFWENIPLFHSQMNLPRQRREALKKQRLANNPIGLANSLLGMGTGAQPSWWQAVEGFQSETLIVVGELDEKFITIGKEMNEKIPNAEICLIKGAGHAIHVEKPEKFGTIVSEFLLQ
jgi:2-succinyl-6-hydroxy-2,4-cyclohexadiene-1-carboxylate synthase